LNRTQVYNSLGGISRFTLQVRIKIRASVGRFLASAGRSKTPTAAAPFYLRAFRFNRGRGERYRKNVTKGMHIRDIGLKVGRFCTAEKVVRKMGYGTGNFVLAVVFKRVLDLFVFVLQ
jgi:hypothetical protein